LRPERPGPNAETRITAFHVLRAAARAGMATRDLARALAVDGAAPPDLHDYVASEKVYALWETVMRELRDPGFPVRVAMIPRAEMRSLVALLATSMPTLEGAARSMTKHWHAVSSTTRWSFARVRGGATLTLTGLDPARLGERCAAEFAVADAIATARGGVGPAFSPSEVRFAHAAPADVRAHRAAFGCPVRFGARATQISLSAAALRLPLATDVPALAAALEAQLRRAVGDAPASDARTGALREAVADLLLGGRRPSIAAAAQRLAVSARTLQRQIRGEGATFQGILADVQRAMAFELLADRAQARTMKEIAHLLGFSGTRAFDRAFRRWAGETPSDYAASQLTSSQR
jgi:AraC-like DNA-binding protein